MFLISRFRSQWREVLTQSAKRPRKEVKVFLDSMMIRIAKRKAKPQLASLRVYNFQRVSPHNHITQILENVRSTSSIFPLPVVALASDALDFDNYEVQYQNQVGRCQLASVDEAYKYTILAEDYMIQVNLVATVGADDPDAFYEQNVLPRQANNMEVVAPSVGLELTGEDVRQLFVTLSKRRLAYHIWTMPRVCLRPDGRASVYLRETGNVQNGEDGEGGGDVFRVFTSIRLDFNRLGKVRRLVSVRDQTLLGNEVFEGNAPTP